MFYALDESDFRVHISRANSNKKYFCPACKSPVLLKKGKIKAHHFCHKSNGFCDPWQKGKMSQWHLDMQSMFPDECREIIVHSEDQSEFHIADVIVQSNTNNYVFEFQHSPISVGAFLERSLFYIELGYSLIWIFDFQDTEKPKKFYYEEYDSFCQYKRILWPGRDRISLFNSRTVLTLLTNTSINQGKLSIWFHINAGPGSHEIFEYANGYDGDIWYCNEPWLISEYFVKLHIDSLKSIRDFHGKFYTNKEFKKYISKFQNK